MSSDSRNADVRYLELLKSCLSGSIYPESAWEIMGGRTRKGWKRILFKFLAKRSFHLVRVKPFREDIREVGRDWPLVGYSMIGRKRLDNVEFCVRSVVQDGVPGDLIETGVWRGGAIILMKAVLEACGDRERLVWAADSFEGLPKPDPSRYGDHGNWDYSHIDFLKVSLEEVRTNIARFGLLDERIRFLKGWFKDTLPTAPINRLAVLRLDGDMYESTMDALVSLYPKVSAGGYVIVDDYHSWPGCSKAVDDYRKKHGITWPIKDIDQDSVFWRLGGVTG